MSAVQQSSFCSCIPNTAGQTAAAAFAIMLIAGTALTVLILLQHDPSLNTTFYPVFGVIGGLGFLGFIAALIAMCKPKPPGKPKKRQPPPYVPMPLPYPYMTHSMPYQPPALPPARPRPQITEEDSD